MMLHFDENMKLAKSLGQSFQYRDIKVGWLGKISASGVVNPDPMDGLEQPYVWVRFEENGEAVRVINLKVSGRMPNVRVHVGRALNGELTVIGLAEENATELGDIAPTLNTPDRIADLILELLDTNRIKPLRVSPGTAAFDVDVAPGFYWHQGELKAWVGDTINIASSVPGGFNTKRPVLIGIDTTTETLVSYDGDVIFMTVPPLRGKMFTEAVIAQTVVDAAMPDVFWVACIPITVNDSDWNDYFRTTALQFTGGNGAAITSGKVLISSDDTTLDYAETKIVAGTGITLSTLNPGANETLQIAASSAALNNYKVKVSAADTTDDYLYPSLVAGNGITLAIASPAADEKVSITVNQAQLALGSLGTRAFLNLSDVPASYAGQALKGLRVNAAANAVEFHDYDPDYVNVTGDSMTGGLSITSTDPGLILASTLTASGADATAHSSGSATLTVNQNSFNLTNAIGGAGLRGTTTVTGTSGTVTGAAGVVGQVTKSGAGTLTNAYSLYANTITSSGGTLSNAIGVYIAPQTVGSVSNYGLFQGGAGLNLLTDQLTVAGSADRIQVIVKGNGTQTANLTEWQNSGGTVLSKVQSDGAIHHGNATNFILLTKTTDLVTNKYNIDNVQPSYAGLGLLRLSGTKSVTTTNSEIYRILDIVATHAVSSGQSSLLGEAINIDITGSGAGNITVLAGILSVIGYNGTGTVSSAYGYRSNFSVGSTGTISNLYNFYALNPTKGGSATLTNNYGFYVDGQTAGTNNWAIYTNAGLVHFGDNVEMADAKNFVFNTTTGTKIGTGTTQKIGFFNKTPIVQPAALTTQLTTLTCSAPGTPDYAIADPVAGGFGFVTLDEALSLIKVIANLQTRFSELETNVIKALGLSA